MKRKLLCFCLVAAALSGCGPSTQTRIEHSAAMGHAVRVMQQFSECERRWLRHAQRLENIEAEYNASELFTEGSLADSVKDVNAFWQLARGCPELLIPAERHCRMLRETIRQMKAAGPQGYRADEKKLEDWIVVIDEGDVLSQRLCQAIAAREKALNHISALCKRHSAYGPSLKPDPNRPTIWEQNGLTPPPKKKGGG